MINYEKNILTVLFLYFNALKLLLIEFALIERNISLWVLRNTLHQSS